MTQSESIFLIISYKTEYSVFVTEVIVIQRNTYCTIYQIGIVRPYILDTSYRTRLRNIISQLISKLAHEFFWHPNQGMQQHVVLREIATLVIFECHFVGDEQNYGWCKLQLLFKSIFLMSFETSYHLISSTSPSSLQMFVQLSLANRNDGS